MKTIKHSFCVLLIALTALCMVSALPLAAAAEGSLPIRGDADCNGVVDVKDVTEIQCVLAELKDDSDGQLTLRADINGDGLDISDATQIQMYLVEFDNIWHIGERLVQPQPTTVQPTTKKPVPTRDPYELPIIFN